MSIFLNAMQMEIGAHSKHILVVGSVVSIAVERGLEVTSSLVPVHHCAEMKAVSRVLHAYGGV